MSRRQIWWWDTIGWIKAFAWVQIIGNTIFTVLLMIGVTFLVKHVGKHDGSRKEWCANGLSLSETTATAVFAMLVLLIFLSFVGIGMGVILMNGTEHLLENDRYLKAWIIYTAITMIIILACATLIGFVGVSMVTSINKT
ncbi:unnamed protein product [Allacma fusca]|uniref:Uncharacterized protein n=2 Tax=Allacma fusca TaxID=39272 RepID=A0A8J2PLZ3_9HEXA|nr:unnamed protein product [Allacma fusca]